MKRTALVLPVVTGVVAAALVSCESSPGSETEGGDAIVVGTTDRIEVTDEDPAPLDPAAAYDITSWNILRNTHQTLLRLSRSGTSPEPEAAKECGFTDRHNEQYRCTLRSGLRFPGGRKLTAQDVKYSMERVLRIGQARGPASLLSNVDAVEAASDTDVVFHLKAPDATFPYKLATPTAAIVDRREYPARRLVEGFKIAGTGPYLLESFDAGGRSVVFRRNPYYRGELEPKNNKVEMRFFKNAADMEKALRAGTVDLVNRTLTPRQVNRLRAAEDEGITLVEMPGQETRSLVFTTDAPAVRDLAVRRAIAQLVDRQALVRDVYERTAEPLYSVVPAGMEGHRNSFFNRYGGPDAEAARRTLRKAGIKTPVKLRLTYTTDHYGPATAKEFEMLRRQLDAGGLFRTTVEGVPWKKFRPAASQAQYDVYGMGWFPYFPDPDNFIAPFFGAGNALGSPYKNSEIEKKVIPETRRATRRSDATAGFVRAQDIIARDVPLLPLWQGKQYVAARNDITGVEWALNSSSVLQLWELGRGTEL